MDSVHDMATPLVCGGQEYEGDDALAMSIGTVMECPEDNGPGTNRDEILVSMKQNILPPQCHNVK